MLEANYPYADTSPGRKHEVRAATLEDDKQLKGTRCPLLKSLWNLSLFDSLRLSQLQRQNERLYRAYLLKDALVRTLDCTNEPLARLKLDQWLRWARRSRLEPFQRIAQTISYVDTAPGERQVAFREARQRGSETALVSVPHDDLKAERAKTSPAVAHVARQRSFQLVVDNWIFKRSGLPDLTRPVLDELSR